MANTLYPNMASLMMNDAGASHTNPDWSAPSGTGWQTHLIDLGTYTYSAAHEDYDDLSGIVTTGGTATITSPTVVAGVFDAADTTHSGADGNTVEAIVMSHKAGGATSVDPLAIFWDTDTGGAISITLNTGDVVIEWGVSILDLVT